MPRIVKLTNCLLAQPESLVKGELYIDEDSGKIVDGQSEFFSSKNTPVRTVDLGSRILAPGFIDVQINGCFGLDFSVPSPNYAAELARVKRELVKTGVTSILPTLTSQRASVYEQNLPYLGAEPERRAENGTESLGAHCEGPFINPEKCGIHKKEVLLKPTSISDLENCYGKQYLQAPTVKMITMAPELDSSRTIIPELRRRGIIHSTGHSAADHEQALDALHLGSTMVTHMYNAMPQPHHRDTGIVGLLGSSVRETTVGRPFFGIIADGIHVHPSMVRLAYTAHPSGCCLVTDAMSVLGLPDGKYPWTNGEYFTKKGEAVILERTGGIAGSAVTLLTCLNNLISWADVSIPVAIQAVTQTPARMLGLDGVKGALTPGADADLVVLSQSSKGLAVDEVWKFGKLVNTDTAQVPKSKL
jgi:N-acetylglucosamine-6-phosphate deacetylase